MKLVRWKQVRVKLLAQATAVSLVLSQAGLSALSAAPVSETALRNAWALYTQQKYAASADAFEALIRTSTPNARLYYYAALANKSSNRPDRTKQLCQYIVANFPSAAEAVSAQKLLVDAPAKPSTSGVDGLPESLKGKSLDELMQTEEGRKALKEALKQQRTAATSPTMASPAVHSSKSGSGQVFTADAVASDGPEGITQFTPNPNGWFECSLAALAMLPRGQQLIAEMIHSPNGQAPYVVRFPGDGVDYTITQPKLEESRVRDKALWATLIHCALVMKIHGSNSWGIEEGLTYLTGKRPETIYATTTAQTLADFIGTAVKAHEPVVCQTAEDISSYSELVEDDHAYTITGFEPASGMIVIRNPHGDNSRRFRLKTDPDHKLFEQLNEGVFKMNVVLFSKYFGKVARVSF